MVSGSSRRAVPSHTAPPTVTPGGQSRAATRGARLVRCPGTHSSGSSACTLARPPAAREASPALNLAAPDVCIPPRRARGALPTCRLRSAIRSPRCSVAATPTPQDSPGPGGTPGHLLPETPFVLLPPPGPSLPSTHPGCKRPCRQRQSAAPSHEHCGAPRVCNAERRPRAARAGSAAEGGRERGWRDAPSGGGGRAPLPLAPGLEGREANQRVQEEPSPPRDSFIGLARTAQLGAGGSRPAAKSANSGRRPPLTGGGKGGTRDLSGQRVPTEDPRLSVCSGCRFLPARDPVYCKPCISPWLNS